MMFNALRKPPHSDYKKIVSKEEEFAIKNMIRERPKILDMINENIVERNNFLQSQKLINIRNETDRLRGLYHNRTITNLRYLEPSRSEDFHDSTNRLEQLQKMYDQELGRAMKKEHNIFRRYNF